MDRRIKIPVLSVIYILAGCERPPLRAGAGGPEGVRLATSGKTDYVIVEPTAHDQSRQLIAKTLSGRDVPNDERYHFHLAGRIKGSANLHFWAHHSWRLRQKLNMTYNSALPEQVAYEVYASIKLEGPAYVPGSTRTNSFSVERLILVEVASPNGQRP